MKLLTYAPDVDPTSPAIVIDGDKFIPTTRGMAGAPSDTNAVQADLMTACVGAATVLKLDGAVRVFAGTATNLYEASSGTWTDVSEATAYAASSSWRFAQFGNVSLAASKANTLQASASGDFASISGAPKASIVITVGQQVLAFDTNDGTYGDSPDRWWCSALGDYTDWTPDIATQCATGRLTDIPGAFTAGLRFGSGAFAGKERGCYFGTYAGPPFIWDWQTLPGEFGPVSQEACVSIGTSEQPRIMFLALNDFYMFDGARPYPIGEGIREAFFRKVTDGYLNKTVMLHDVSRALVYVFYPASGATLPNAGLAYHYRSNRWGVVNLNVRAAMNYTTPAATFANIPVTTFDSFPDVPFNELFAAPGTVGLPAFIDDQKRLRILNGPTGVSYLITGHYGDDLAYTYARKLRIRWLRKPTTGRMEGYSASAHGNDFVKKSEATMTDNRFNFEQSGRWHKFLFQFSGDWEMNEFTPDVVEMGEE